MYKSEATIRLSGVAKHRGLVRRLQKDGKGYIETLSPFGTPEKMYEFHPYRVVCYHPAVEAMVREFIKQPDVQFKVVTK